MVPAYSRGLCHRRRRCGCLGGTRSLAWARLREPPPGGLSRRTRALSGFRPKPSRCSGRGRQAVSAPLALCLFSLNLPHEASSPCGLPELSTENERALDINAASSHNIGY